VLPLARHGGHNVLKELMGNPLIIATLCGLAGNAVGLQLPEPVAITLGRIGQAALPLGLMAVGAGLHLGAVREHPGLAAGLLGIRHLALPLVALGLADVLALPPLERSIAVAFGALPTASSAYVLAVRMRGNGPFVAGLITVSTMLGMATIPVWLAIGLPAR
jgi:predicted permease